jgi:hypothetical protein
MKQLLFIITLLFSFNTIAQDGYKGVLDFEVPEGTVSLCKEKNSTGYNWENGEWVLQNFKPEEFIVKKVPYKNINKEKNVFLSPCSEIDDQGNYPSNVRRCYNIRNFGEEEKSYSDRICREYYADQKLYRIECAYHIGTTFNFLPNGLFVNTYLVFNLGKEEERKKDSMMLSHGLCATIN